MIRGIVLQKVREIERRSEDNTRTLDAIVNHLEDSPHSAVRCIKHLLLDILFAVVVVVSVTVRVCWRNLAAISLVICAAVVCIVVYEVALAVLRWITSVM